MASLVYERENCVAVAVVRTRPRAIPLAMITMRKSTHGFPYDYGAPLAGAPLLIMLAWKDHKLLRFPITRGLKNSKLNRQMRFSLRSIKCFTVPPSFRLLPSIVSLSELCTTIWLPGTRQWSEGGEELPNISLTVAKNAFVGWALSFRVRMLLSRGAVKPKKFL